MVMTPERDFSVSFILPNGFDLGGVTSWSMELAERLAEAGQQTTLVRHIDSYVSGEYLVPDGVRLVECPHRIHPNHWYLFKSDIDTFHSVYGRLPPSVIIPNYSFGSYAACARLAAEAADIRVLGMAHTDHIEYYQWLVQFESIIHRFVAVSSEIAEHLAELLPHREQDIVVRPCGVAVDSRLERHYSDPGGPLKIMYAGRLSERQKNVSDLVRLAVVLAEQGVDFELRIYGAGRDRNSLESLVESRNEIVRKKVFFCGQVAAGEMAALYASSDILVLVSEYEGTSVSMLEAMAQGCVPVVNRVSGTAEVIAEGVNGFSVPVGDVGQMVEKIAWLNSDRSRLRELGREAHKTVYSHHSYEDYVPWFSTLLDELWQEELRPWKGRPFHFYFPVRHFITEAGYVLAAKPGLRWLYRLKGPLKRVIG